MIYSDVARALRSARSLASSQAQLRMLDRVAKMIADDLVGYNRFNPEAFLTQCGVGLGVFIDNELER